MPAQTGLSQLGDALLRGTGDYANIALRRRQEEEQRAQQLADLQNARLYSEGQREGDRRYSEGQFDKERGLSLEDEKRHRGQKIDDETYQILLKEGWLKPVDAANPTAIAAAADNRQKYIDKERQDETDFQENAQTELNSLAKDRERLALKDTKLDESITNLQRQYDAAFDQTEIATPTRKMIVAEALKMAAERGVIVADKEPKRSEQLRDYITAAEKQLGDKAGLAALAARDKLKSLDNQHAAAVREKQATTGQLQVVRMAIADLERQAKRAPVRAKQSPAETLNTMPSVNDEGDGERFVPQAATPADKAAAAAGDVAPPVAVVPSPAQALQAPAAPPTHQTSGAPGANPAVAALLFGDKILPAVKPVLKSIPAFLRGAVAAGGVVAKNAFPVARAGYLGYTAGDILNQTPTWVGGRPISDYLANGMVAEPLPGDYMSEARAKALKLRRSLDQPLPALNSLPPYIDQNALRF